ncbi:MAG: DUF2092 domain-containing protein [Kiritimatiellae bacterium]|nr:DUF2092 domain-containing protein [Kiritimatiellia bacterium]
MTKRQLSLIVVLTAVTVSLTANNSIAAVETGSLVYKEKSSGYYGGRNYGGGRRSRSVYQRGFTQSNLNYDKAQEQNIKNQGDALSRQIMMDEYKDVLPAGYSSIALSNLSPEAKAVLDEKKAASDAAKKAAKAKGKTYVDPVNPNATKILQKMSDYIGGLKTLRMSLDEIKEVATKSGKIVQERVHQTYLMKRPNKLSVVSRGTKVDKKFLFDGKNVAVRDYKNDKEFTVAMPGSVDNLIQNMYDKRDYVVPVADLLYSDIFSSINSNLTQADYKGIAMMDNKQCHYVMCMSGGVRWQIWITSKGNPIPLRIIIDYPGRSSVRRYAVKITDLRSAGELTDNKYTTTEDIKVAGK